MRILYINTYYYPNTYGGAEISVQILAEYMAKCSHNVFILCIDKFEKNEIINKVMVYRIKEKNYIDGGGVIEKIDLLLKNTYNTSLYSKFDKCIREIMPDVIHTNNLLYISPIVWTIAKKMKIPLVHTCRDYMLLTKNPIKKNLLQILSKNVNGVTAPSQYTLNTYLSNNYFCKSLVQEKIYNALENVNISQELIEKKMNKYDATIRFAYLGRYEEHKGINWLIESFKNENKNKLYLYGHGSLEDEINVKVKQCTNIINKGFLEQNQLYEELKEMDVIVVPSLWEEPFGRVIIDAFLNLCPVIVTNKGGMPELVLNKKNGIVIDCHEKSLLEAIRYMSDRNKIKLMFPYIIEYIKEFSINDQTIKFLNIYRKVCK